MIDYLDASSTRFLNSLNGISQRMDRAQRELTSGKRMNTVSDDPDQVGTLLQYRADSEMNARTQTSLGRVKTEVDTAESVMASSVRLLQQARVLTAQGSTGTATAEERASLADQLGNILQQLSTMANTTVEGRYVFSGDSDQTSPYTIDLTLAVPYSTYLGTAATRQVLTTSGTTISVSKTAQDIFDTQTPGQQSVFAAINDARLAFQANDQTAINTAAAEIDSAGTYLNVQHEFYGSAQLQVNNAIDTAQTTATRLKTQISQVEDADATAAILDLSNAILQQNAALQSRAKMPRTSLFDYLG